MRRKPGCLFLEQIAPDLFPDLAREIEEYSHDTGDNGSKDVLTPDIIVEVTSDSMGSWVQNAKRWELVSSIRDESTPSRT